MNRLKHFFLFIRGADSDLALENRVFNLTLFIGSILFFFIACSNYYVGLSPIAIISPCITGITCLYIYYHSRFLQKFPFVAIISVPILYGLIATLWFVNAGQEGSIIHSLQLFLLFFFAVLPRKYHVKLLVFHILFMFSLYVLEYIFPEWVTPYNTRKDQFIDQVVTMIVSLVCVYAIMVTIKNIYEEKNKEVEIQKKNLESLNLMKDKMLSVISHDVRSPLGQIKSVLSLINDNYISKEKSEILLKELYKNVHETQDLLDTLVTWASFQLQGKEGNFNTNLESVKLKSIVSEVISLFSLQMNDKKITVECTIFPELNVFSDANILTLIIRNLVSNAIKFSYREGVISFSAEKKGEYVVLIVGDNGVGIESERLEKFFKFGQNSSTRGTNNEKGSGLGLLLCKEFIEKTGGKLEIESEVKKGSRFIVSIPSC